MKVVAFRITCCVLGLGLVSPWTATADNTGTPNKHSARGVASLPALPAEAMRTIEALKRGLRSPPRPAASPETATITGGPELLLPNGTQSNPFAVEAPRARLEARLETAHGDSDEPTPPRLLPVAPPAKPAMAAAAEPGPFVAPASAAIPLNPLRSSSVAEPRRFEPVNANPLR